jgi:hypothetical protein
LFLNKISEGRTPRFKQRFALLREVYLVGNNDAHGKNFSLLYRVTRAENFEIGLAPFDDVVSTIIYYPELRPDMPMRIGWYVAASRNSPKGSSPFSQNWRPRTRSLRRWQC